MGKPKLTYFDFHGGRGEAPRLAFHYGGVEFEDDRVSFERWKRLQSQTPFGSLPLLEVDGRMVTQASGILRYAGKRAGLYPEDDWQAALCDEAVDVVEETAYAVVPTFGLKGAELEAARTHLLETKLRPFLRSLNGFLEERGGRHFAGGRLTVADLRVFVWARHIRRGGLDHIPAELVDEASPRIADLCDRIADDPKIRDYYDR